MAEKRAAEGCLDVQRQLGAGVPREPIPPVCRGSCDSSETVSDDITDALTLARLLISML